MVTPFTGTHSLWKERWKQSCRLFCCTLLLLISCHARPEEDMMTSTRVHEFRLGDSRIKVTETFKSSNGSLVFIQLHDNEKTANETALKAIEKYGGRFISINNQGKRNIDFTSTGKKYKVDPNRIFTSTGIRQSLDELGRMDDQAVEIVEGFADFLLSLIPESSVVIAVHNNSNNNYTVDDYKKHLSRDAKDVYINPEMDPDDFIFTTRSQLFESMGAKNMNAVLQHNQQVKNDGSLSVYFGKMGRVYVNVEAQHGHDAMQWKMLEAVMENL